MGIKQRIKAGAPIGTIPRHRLPSSSAPSSPSSPTCGSIATLLCGSERVPMFRSSMAPARTASQPQSLPPGRM
tara:strand:- start:942 stop:1160 length:219 start_codon:yes stop_codon:yes gene_type:complete